MMNKLLLVSLCLGLACWWLGCSGGDDHCVAGQCGSAYTTPDGCSERYHSHAQATTIATPADLMRYEDATSFGGPLTIACPDCPNLDGLRCLDWVMGDLRIKDNRLLSSLEGLDVLSRVDGKLQVADNESLTSLYGLGDPPRLVGEIQVLRNPALTSLDGLIGAAFLEDDTLEQETIVWISDNPSMPDCEVCLLLGELPEPPAYVVVEDNLDDACTPVPENCP